MIYLVSRSPRRAKILRDFGYEFKVVETSYEEKSSVKGEKDVALLNAKRKLNLVKIIPKSGVLVAADTIVWVDGRILGKPQDVKEAVEHLSILSGRSHYVVTGVAMFKVDTGEREYLLEETLVTFFPLDREEIEWLALNGEAIDKAGSYAIQGRAGIFVRRIEGCYMNVVGLPLPSMYPILRRWGELPNGLSIP